MSKLSQTKVSWMAANPRQPRTLNPAKLKRIWYIHIIIIGKWKNSSYFKQMLSGEEKREICDMLSINITCQQHIVYMSHMQYF